MICRPCCRRREWPQFLADTSLQFDWHIFFLLLEQNGIHSHIVGARGLPLPLVFSRNYPVGHMLVRIRTTCLSPDSFLAYSMALALSWQLRFLLMRAVRFYCYPSCITFRSHLFVDTWTSGPKIINIRTHLLNRLWSNVSYEMQTSGSRSYAYEDHGDMITWLLGEVRVLRVSWRLTPLWSY